MMVVSTTGHIISSLGPYFSDGKNNDANILIHGLKTNAEDMSNWLREGDIVVVDRGFRDSVEFLNDLGIKTEMPVFLKRGQKQHTVEESNSSRLVTKIRWVVESVNGKLKCWKYLANIIPNSQIPYIGEYVSLVSAIVNKYCKPLNPSQVDGELTGCKMLYLSTQNNCLKERIERDHLERRPSNWLSVSSAGDCFNDFPKLQEDDLRQLTLGVYQLKLAKSYSVEHLNTDSSYEMFVNKQDEGLLMGKIQSRHVSSRSHKLWIEYDDVMVKGWYCQCRSGARVVDTCAHVASVVWFLGCARHRDIDFNVSVDWSAYLTDAKDLPEPQLIDDDNEVSTEE